MGKNKITGYVFYKKLVFLIVCITCVCTVNAYVYERKNVVVLLYHNLLGGDSIPEGDFSLTTNAVKFESDIAALLEHGLKPISLNDMYENKYDRKSKYFAITFDDGYLSNYEIAFPILKKYNCCADIFINTHNNASEYADEFFSYEQAKEMEASGLISIHSHFSVHKDVRGFSDEEFLRELWKSFDVLAEKLGKRKYYFLAYPYGIYDEGKYEAAEKSGVNLQFTQACLSEKAQLVRRRIIDFDTDIAEMLKTAYKN